jgi:nitrogen fixation protein FixH
MTMKFHWGVAVALFYAAFALSTVGFVVYALSLDVDLVSDDYYARALGHDAHMQAVANGRALGAAISVTVEPGRLDVRLPPAMAARVRGTATLYRAAHASADRTVALVPAPDGTQIIPTDGLTPGQWRLQVRWSADGRDYYVERDIRLP